jgi:arsenate reductase-like glutaredoxin family protein
MRAKPLSEAELKDLLKDQPASLLYSRKGRQNKALGIDPDALSEEEMLALMAREPALIRRPTLVVDGQVVPQPSKARLEEIAREHGRG